MADFSFTPAAAGIKPVPQTSLADMIGVARGAQAYQQAQQVNPLQVQQAQAELQRIQGLMPEEIKRATAEANVAEQTQAPRISAATSQAETNRIAALKAQYGLDEEQHATYAKILGGFANDPRLKPENIQTNPTGPADVMHEISAEAKNAGIPEKKLFALTAPGMAKALQDPNSFNTYFQNMIQRGMTASEQRGLSLPQAVVGAGGQQLIRDPNTGDLRAPNISQNVPYIYKSTGRINPITNAPTMEISAPNGAMIGEFDIPATGLPAAGTQPPTAPGQGAAPSASTGPAAPVINAVPSTRIIPGETAETMKLAKNIQINANEAAKGVAQSQANNNQIISLADNALAGLGAQTASKLGGGLALVPWTSDATKNRQTLGHYIALETANLASSAGLGTDAARGIASQMAGTTDWTPEAIKSTARVNRALSGATGFFNEGVNNAVTQNNNNPFAARDFQNKWSQIADVNALRLMDLMKNNDTAGMASLINELGGPKAAKEKLNTLKLKVSTLNNLIQGGK